VVFKNQFFVVFIGNVNSLKLCFSAGAYVMGNAMYRASLHACPVNLLNTVEGRMKMELANMYGLLTNNSLFGIRCSN
jgi:hypothetical protein